MVVGESEAGSSGIVEAIESRASAAKLRPERPPRVSIERLLEVAVRAPNHHLTQPWRFFVLSGPARDELGAVMAQSLRASLPQPETPQAAALIEAEAHKPLRAPVVIVVACVHGSHPKALQVEDVAATAAAVQNMMLAAPSLGLGIFWRTGKPASDPAVKELFGLRPDDDILAFLYVGHPEAAGSPGRRESAAQLTTWRWED